MKERYRTIITTYIAAQRHLRGDGRDAKTLTQMAKEIGTTKSTVSRWLRRDHWAHWMDHWASAEEIWKAEQQTRAQLPQEVREAKRQATGQGQAVLMAHLDRCLAELASGDQIDTMA